MVNGWRKMPLRGHQAVEQTRSLHKTGIHFISRDLTRNNMPQVKKVSRYSPGPVGDVSGPQVAGRKRPSQIDKDSNTSQPPKKRKIGKNNGTGQDNKNDYFCWQCHREGNVICCELCPRVYHSKCIGIARQLPDNWVCPECEKTMRAECMDTRSKAMSMITTDQLCQLLRFALNRMMFAGTEAFQKPVDQAVVSLYSDYVFNPVDMRQLERNIKRKKYGSTEAFMADVKWLQHNCVIFNGPQHQLSSAARSIVKICKHETNEIEICPDCYLNSCVKQNDVWFCEPCRSPHTLVWAKLKGYPFWPAKALREADGQADVRFFGAHDRSWVPVSQVFLLSKEIPTPLRKSRAGFETAMEELELHITKIREKFGSFKYAQFRTPYDRREVYFQNRGKVNQKPEQVKSPVPAKVAKSPRTIMPDVKRLDDKQREIVVKKKAASALKIKYNSIITTRRAAAKALGAEADKQNVFEMKDATNRKLADAEVKILQQQSAKISIAKLKHGDIVTRVERTLKGMKAEESADISEVVGVVGVGNGASCDSGKLETGEVFGANDFPASGSKSSEYLDRHAKERKVTLASKAEVEDNLNGGLLSIVKHQTGNTKGRDNECSTASLVKLSSDEKPMSYCDVLKTGLGNADVKETTKKGTVAGSQYQSTLLKTIESCKAKLKLSDGEMEKTNADILSDDERREEDVTNRDESDLDAANNEHGASVMSKRSSSVGNDGNDDVCDVKLDIRGSGDDGNRNGGKSGRKRDCRSGMGTSGSPVESARSDQDDASDVGEDREREKELSSVLKTRGEKWVGIRVSEEEMEGRDDGGCLSRSDGGKNGKEPNTVGVEQEKSVECSAAMVVDECTSIENDGEAGKNIGNMEKMETSHGLTNSCEKSEKMDEMIDTSTKSVTTRISTSCLQALPTCGVLNDMASPKSQNARLDRSIEVIEVESDSSQDHLVIDTDNESERTRDPGHGKTSLDASDDLSRAVKTYISTVEKVAKTLDENLTRNCDEDDKQRMAGKEAASVVSPVDNVPLTNVVSPVDKVPLTNVVSSVDKVPLMNVISPVDNVPLSNASEKFTFGSISSPTLLVPYATAPITERPGGVRAVGTSSTTAVTASSTLSLLLSSTTTSIGACVLQTAPNIFAPHTIVSPLLTNPIMSLSVTETNDKTSSGQSKVSAITKKYHEKMGSFLADTIKEIYEDINQQDTNKITVDRLNKDLDVMRYTHDQEISEIRHNLELNTNEIKRLFEKEKASLKEELAARHTEEKVKLMKEIKKKQWCAQCQKEAVFYCCWNTSYCDYPCQISHWPDHMAHCTQNTPQADSEGATLATTTAPLPTVAIIAPQTGLEPVHAVPQMMTSAPNNLPIQHFITHVNPRTLPSQFNPVQQPTIMPRQVVMYPLRNPPLHTSPPASLHSRVMTLPQVAAPQRAPIMQFNIPPSFM